MSFNFDLVKILYFAEKPVKTLYIDGKEKPLVCTITYNANGATSGTAPNFQEGSYGDTITLRTNSGNLGKTNYDFIGWNTKADGSGTTYSAGGSYTINDDVILYACWRIKYEITFKSNITFSDDKYYVLNQSGTAALVGDTKKRISQGSSIGSFPTGYGTSSSGLDYSLSGVTYYIYVEGWYSDYNCTKSISTSTVPTGNTTYYAKWKMTANVGISASITVPKFATSVSWTCYSDGGSRSAINRTGSSGGLGWQMAAPGANRNVDSWTWTGAIQGKTLTLGTMSCDLNGVTRSVSTPGAGGLWDYHIKVIADLFDGRGTISAGSKTYSSGNYKVIISWPAIGENKSGYLTMAYYYANSLKATVSTKYRIDVGDSDDGYPRSYTVETRTYSGTFASGTYGAAGAYGSASYHTSSVSRVTVAAAGGSGYSRTVTVNA